MKNYPFKTPKRADVYWLVHVHTTDDPYTKEYQVTHVIPNSIIRIELKLGFRIDPDIHLMFRYIISELDRSNLTVEQFPLMVSPVPDMRLKRV